MSGLRERNKSKRRNAIIEAAVLLLRTDDFGAVTIDRVAEHAEVSPHTVYNLVGTRDDLALALFSRVVGTLATTAPRFEDPNTDPSDALRSMTEHFVEALLQEPVAHRSIVRAVSALPRWPAGARQPFVLYEQASARLGQVGALQPGITAELLARHVVLGLFGALTSWARGTSDERFRQEAHMSVALVLCGMTRGEVAEQAAETVTELGLSSQAIGPNRSVNRG